MLLACLTSTSIMAQGKGNPEAAKVKNPAAATPESVAAGKVTFSRYCTVCHGSTAEGGSGSDISPPAPALTDDK